MGSRPPQPPARQQCRRRAQPRSIEQVLKEATRHDRLAESLLKRDQRVAAALQRGMAMGLRDACNLLGYEAGFQASSAGCQTPATLKTDDS